VVDGIGHPYQRRKFATMSAREMQISKSTETTKIFFLLGLYGDLRRCKSSSEARNFKYFEVFHPLD
jgi:hypothetical protein